MVDVQRDRETGNQITANSREDRRYPLYDEMHLVGAGQLS